MYDVKLLVAKSFLNKYSISFGKCQGVILISYCDCKHEVSNYMIIFLYIMPVALLVTYSQLVVKWRSQLGGGISLDRDFASKLLGYFADWYILSAYIAALLGSFFWLFVVTRIPLSIGFPVYIGVTSLMVIMGSWLFLGEPVTIIKLIAAGFILTGIVIGAIES
jgi:multidrug transporter EmrE-like cation transporter